MNCPTCKRHDEFVFEENTRVWRCDRCHERFLMKPRGTNEDAKEQLVRVVTTNADRIRGMNDEELAREMLFFVPSDFNRHYTGIAGGYYATADEAIQANFDWLKQPVKEE